MTKEEVIDLCFITLPNGNTAACKYCAALVPVDWREVHLGYHHPDLSPEPHAGRSVPAGWKLGIPPSWALEGKRVDGDQLALF